MVRKSNKKDNQDNQKQIVIDASNATLGRLASFAAKQALLDNKIIILNSEKAIIMGSKHIILQDYKKKRSRGRGSLKGPYFPRKPEAILKRTIRGMLPYKTLRGRKAFKNIKCFLGTPQEYARVKKIVSRKEKTTEYISLGELSKIL